MGNETNRIENTKPDEASMADDEILSFGTVERVGFKS